MEVAARTDVGLVREHNEDRFLVRPGLLVVADGMGGAKAGEVAAGLAVEHLERLGGESSAAELTGAIEEANRAIRRLAEDDPERAGMGTTITAAMLGDGSVAEVLHVGDSRAYLLREGELRLLTRDHSMVAELVDRGTLTPEEAETHPQRNVITRALGAEPEVRVDHLQQELQPGDTLLLCTDGLSAHVPEAEIEAALNAAPSLDAAVDALVALANEAGGTDNVTVLLARVVPGGSDGTEAAPTAGG
jgi:PPM family protein phosphatase